MTQPSSQPTGKPAGALGAILARTAWVVFAEAIAVAAFAVYLLWGFVTGQAKLASADLTLVVLFGAAGAWLWYIGVSLRRGKRWSRSAAIFWQTCQLFLASQSFTGRGANWLIGVLLIASAIWVLGNLFMRSVLNSSKSEIDKGE